MPVTSTKTTCPCGNTFTRKPHRYQRYCSPRCPEVPLPLIRQPYQKTAQDAIRVAGNDNGHILNMNPPAPSGIEVDYFAACTLCNALIKRNKRGYFGSALLFICYMRGTQ